MKAVYWQKGDSLDFENKTSATIEAGDVIDFKTRIGVAGTEIKPKEVGSVHMIGVFQLPRKSEAEIAMGKEVYLSSDGITATKGSNTPAGYAAELSPTEAKTILVKLLG